MRSRRAVLAALATALPGCQSDRVYPTRVYPPPTPVGASTATPTPTPDPLAGSRDCLGESRFDPRATACPWGENCYHKHSLGDEVESLSIPDREVFDAAEPAATFHQYNLADAQCLRAPGGRAAGAPPSPTVGLAIEYVRRALVFPHDTVPDRHFRFGDDVLLDLVERAGTFSAGPAPSLCSFS